MLWLSSEERAWGKLDSASATAVANQHKLFAINNNVGTYMLYRYSIGVKGGAGEKRCACTQRSKSESTDHLERPCPALPCSTVS